MRNFVVIFTRFPHERKNHMKTMRATFPVICMIAFLIISQFLNRYKINMIIWISFYAEKKNEESIQINTWCLSEQVRFCVNDLLQLCLLVHIFNQVFFFTQFISQHKVGLFPSFAFLSPTVCHPERNTMYFLYHLVWFGVLEGTWANIGPRLRWDSNKTPGITTHKKCILQWTKIY